jgi:hypothetical protein
MNRCERRERDGQVTAVQCFTTSQSPLTPRPNPSVKGTSRRRAAPYVER